MKLFLSFAMLSLISSAQAQQPVITPRAEQLLESLVAELKALRQALELGHANDTVRQIVLERYRVLHETTSGMADRLSATKAELAGVRSERPRLEVSVKNLEDRLRVVVEPDRRTGLEAELKESQDALGQIKEREIALAELERQLVFDHRAESGKLQAIEQVLDSLLTAATKVQPR